MVGSDLLRAYMHGFFMDMKLYHKVCCSFAAVTSVTFVAGKGSR